MRLLRSINYGWRLFATGLSFFLFGLGGVIVPLIATPIIFVISSKPAIRQKHARLLVHRMFRLFVRFMALTGILSWDIKGIEKLQRGNIVILANHPTLLDVVFLVSFVPHADCIVKGRLMQNPAMRGFVSLTGYITNDRGEELITGAVNSLSAGSALIIFPEGTRTRPDQAMTFQRGAANILVRSSASAVPVIIDCQPSTLGKHHKWYHIPHRKFHLSFRVLDDFPVESYRLENASLGARKLTRDIKELITEEIAAYERPVNRNGTEGADNKNPGTGGYCS